MTSRKNQHEIANISVYDLLLRQAETFGDHPLFILPDAVRELWKLPQSQWSYREVLHAVNVLKERYRAAGYGKNTRIALLLENRPVHFFHWLALNAIGTSVVPVNPDYKADELAYLLEHSESTLIVCLASRLEQVSRTAKDLNVNVLVEGEAEIPSCASRSSGFIQNDEAALIYTSGTTGNPKGCILSNEYFLGWSKWYGAQGGLINLRSGEERLMTPLPAFHVNAMGNSFMGMLGSGGAQVIIDRFHPRTWWEMAIETQATCFHYLGVMPAILMAIEPSKLDQAHQFRFGMGGGVHPDHHDAFEKRFGVPLLEGWAMTETGGGGILCAVEEPRHVGKRCIGSHKRNGPPMEIRLVDDHGIEQKAGQAGELLLRARGDNPRRHFFSGYLKDDEATRKVWQDEWLHTGDIMRMDEQGNLYFVDRKKNIIRRSGENIAAVEIETMLIQHPSIKQLAVVAANDPMRGEEVLAIVIRDKTEMRNNEELAQEIFDFCAPKLAYYKLPGYITFLDELPTTATQKIRKSDLGPLAQNPGDHPETFDFRDVKQSRRHKTS